MHFFFFILIDRRMYMPFDIDEIVLPGTEYVVWA